MADHDMTHMDHLAAVAAADVEHLREKEATYQGSWKRRGGVGAFMMLARKWDRLEAMLNPAKAPGDQREAPVARWARAPIPGFDVFAAIAAQPVGEDGTVLAEVRDLRRYLLLVEAEMVARGAVARPRAPTIAQRWSTDMAPTNYPPGDRAEPGASHPPPTTEPTGVTSPVSPALGVTDVAVTEVPPLSASGVVEALAHEAGVLDPRGEDLYAEVARAWSLPRSEVKARVMRMAFGDPAADRPEADVLYALGFRWRCDRGEARRTLVEKTYPGGSTRGHPARETYETGTPPPEDDRDSARHAANRLTDGMDLGYYLHEEKVQALKVGDAEEPGLYVVDRRAAAPERWEHLPRLAHEQNAKEWEELPREYRWMYSWSGDKFLLRPDFNEHWGR